MQKAISNSESVYKSVYILANINSHLYHFLMFNIYVQKEKDLKFQLFMLICYEDACFHITGSCHTHNRIGQCAGSITLRRYLRYLGFWSTLTDKVFGVTLIRLFTFLSRLNTTSKSPGLSCNVVKPLKCGTTDLITCW